jgi:hypothetical protein
LSIYDSEFVDYIYDDSVEAQDIDVTKILNYPLDTEPLDFDAYALPKATQVNNEVPKALPALEGALGVWHGFMYWPATSPRPSAGMCSMNLEPSSTQADVQLFTAADRANRSEFKIDGKAREGATPGTVSISFKRSFPARFPAQYYVGTWDAVTQTLTGTFGLEDPEDSEGTQYGAFVFKRIAPEYMCFSPAPVELEANKPRALWTFAIESVRFDIRRKRWSWAFFKERRDNRQRFIELYIRSTKFGPPMGDEEWQELARVKKTLTTADRSGLNVLFRLLC